MNLMSLTWVLIYFKAAFNTGWSTHTCPLSVYRWVSWHCLQGSVTKEIHKSAQECKFFFLTIMPSTFLVLLTVLHWSGILFSDINTHPVLLNWCGRCPDTSLSHPVRHWETEPPVPVWRPCSEHAEAEKKKKKVVFHSQGTLNSQMYASL